jgi:hypothetical protein
MSMPLDTDLLDEAMPEADDGDFPIDDWSPDELDDGADLSSLRSAWMGSNDRFE